MPHCLVSILVFMEVALDRGSVPYHYRVYSVSILVFMEVALDPYRYLISGERNECFNPCFHGSSSRSKVICTVLWSCFEVSILVFMEVALDHIHRTPVCLPLFFVSILVFMEVALDRQD